MQCYYLKHGFSMWVNGICFWVMKVKSSDWAEEKCLKDI